MVNSIVGAEGCPARLTKAAAFARNEARVLQAGVIEGTVPTASLAPFAPGKVVAILGVGISGFACRAKDALSGMGYQLPGHYGSCQHGRKDYDSTNQSKFRHAFLLGFTQARPPNIHENSLRGF
jgi:hypothetical protein